MDLHRKLSESSDDSNASDDSMDRPLSFKCDEEKPEEIIQRNRKAFEEFKRLVEELKSEYDRNHPTLISKIKELKDISDEIESVHKNTRVGSSVGSSIGAVGGVTGLVGLVLSPFTFGASLALTAVRAAAGAAAGGVTGLVGLALAPFTFGASLALTAVGAVAGAVAGAAGGATVAPSNLTDMVKQKNLKQTIVKIIRDFLEIIKPMTEHLRRIFYIVADIQRMNEILSKVEFQTPVRGFGDLCKIAKVADVALIGKLCAEAAKEIRVYVKAVNAIPGPAQAASAICGPAQSAIAIRETADKIRMSAVGGVLSVLFPAHDVASIVEDSTEPHEMNQPAKERKAEEVKSEILKFIHLMRDLASQFQETLDKIKRVINTFN